MNIQLQSARPNVEGRFKGWQRVLWPNPDSPTVTHDVDKAALLSDRIVMMSNGPAATIGEILPVPLSRPRDRLALAEDPQFVHLRQQVLQFLYAKHSAPAIAEPQAKIVRPVELAQPVAPSTVPGDTDQAA